MKTQPSRRDLVEKNQELVTALKNSEKALDDQKHFSDSLFEALREGCLILDEDLYVKSANTAFCELFRVEAEETRGELLYELGNNQWDIPELRKLLEEMLPAEKEIDNYEITHEFEDIGRRVMILNARRINHLQLILLAIEDATERTKALKDLNKSHNSLEARVEERTMQVRKLASRLTHIEQEERQRISGILHDDLQQLLVAINMNLKTLHKKTKQDETPGDLSEQIAQIIQLTEPAIEKTRQLTVDLNPSVLKSESLTQMLNWLTGRFEDMYNLKTDLNIHVNLQIPEKEPRVILLQTVRELLFNIVKHADTDQAIIRVNDRDDEDLVVHVIDEGKGFDVDQVEDKESFGLSNVQDRLNLFGGNLLVESAPGRGTHMTIRLPVDYGSAEEGES